MRLRFLLLAASGLLAPSPSHGASFDRIGELVSGGTSFASAVSADGTVVVGDSVGQATVWTRTGGLEALPLPPAWTFAWSRANAISPDGSTIVGVGSAAASPQRLLPIVWRRVAGAYEVATLAELIDLAADSTTPFRVSLIDVSADGAAVLGNRDLAT